MNRKIKKSDMLCAEGVVDEIKKIGGKCRKLDENEIIDNYIKKLINKEIKACDIPVDIRDNEKFFLEAIKRKRNISISITYLFEYMGRKIKNNKEFAKKIFKMKYGYLLRYFSDDVKNDFECCKAACVKGWTGYQCIGDKLKKNKELALEGIKSGCNIKDVDKSLRKDKDIIKAYWDSIENDMLIDACMIIGIDEYGNNLIDNFLKVEETRHTEERKAIYEEQTEEIRFVKYIEGKPNKELLKKEYNPFIIILGEKENEISKKINEEYYDETDLDVDIIEIYNQDTNTKNIKIITEEQEKIFNVLRFITYTTAGDTFLTEDNLSDIRLWLNKKKFLGKEINLEKVVLNKNKIEEFFKEKKYKGKFYIIQITTNGKITINEYYNIFNQLENSFENDAITEFHLHDSCNIEEIEILILEV